MMKLDKEQFDEGIGVILKCANQDIIDDITDLAHVLAEDGDNVLAQQNLENCKRFQAQYNEGFLPSIQALTNDFQAMYDITEMIEKVQTDSISNVDTSFKTSGINADDVIL